MAKKKYEKPNIVFESFEFCENVAYGCLFISHAQAYECPVDTGVGIIIMDITVCTGGVPPTGNDTICYHVPTVSNNIFTS